jgi:hypothetical protein
MKYTVCYKQILVGEIDIEAKSAQQASKLADEKLAKRDFIKEVEATYQDRIIREDGLDCLGSDDDEIIN